MAIVLTTPKNNIIPVYGTTWIKMYDDVNYANPKLYYEVSVYLNGGVVVNTYNISPDKLGYGNIEICNILQNYVTSEIITHDEFIKNTTLLQYASFSITSKGSGVVSATNSYITYFWNAVNDIYDSFYYDYNLYSGLSKVLTNVNNYTMRLNDSQYIHILSGLYTINNVPNKQAQSPITNLKVTNYYKNGSSVSKTMPITGRDWTAKRITSINISPSVLNFQMPGLNINDNTYYYTIEDANNNWKPIRINLEPYDNRTNCVTTYYVNNCGTTQSANFTKVTNSEYSTKKTLYTSNDRTKVYNNNVDRSFTTSSGYLKEEESDNLKYLFMSPTIIVKENGINKNIILKDKSNKVLTRRNSNLIQYELNWDYDSTFNVQRY